MSIHGGERRQRDKGLTFPLGLLEEAGYRKMPPYLRVRCMSATMEPT